MLPTGPRHLRVAQIVASVMQSMTDLRALFQSSLHATFDNLAIFHEKYMTKPTFIVAEMYSDYNEEFQNFFPTFSRFLAYNVSTTTILAYDQSSPIVAKFDQRIRYRKCRLQSTAAKKVLKCEIEGM